MTINEVMDSLTGIFREVLDNDNISLQPTTTADEVEEWDSITHMMLVVEVEKHFGIRFTAAEVRQWNNVGDLANSILDKKQ